MPPSWMWATHNWTSSQLGWWLYRYTIQPSSCFFWSATSKPLFFITRICCRSPKNDKQNPQSITCMANISMRKSTITSNSSMLTPMFSNTILQVPMDLSLVFTFSFSNVLLFFPHFPWFPNIFTMVFPFFYIFVHIFPKVFLDFPPGSPRLRHPFPTESPVRASSSKPVSSGATCISSSGRRDSRQEARRLSRTWPRLETPWEFTRFYGMGKPSSCWLGKNPSEKYDESQLGW